MFLKCRKYLNGRFNSIYLRASLSKHQDSTLKFSLALYLSITTSFRLPVFRVWALFFFFVQKRKKRWKHEEKTYTGFPLNELAFKNLRERKRTLNVNLSATRNCTSVWWAIMDTSTKVFWLEGYYPQKMTLLPSSSNRTSVIEMELIWLFSCSRIFD